MEPTIDFALTPSEFAVLAGLFGLAVAMMQGDEETSKGYAQHLSNPEVEPIAKRLMDRLSELSQVLMQQSALVMPDA